MISPSLPLALAADEILGRPARVVALHLSVRSLPRFHLKTLIVCMGRNQTLTIVPHC